MTTENETADEERSGEVLMKQADDFRPGQRGAVMRVAATKTRIPIRLDDDVLEWFRAEVHHMGGGSYQALINQALRDYVQHQREPLEKILRCVLREE